MERDGILRALDEACGATWRKVLVFGSRAKLDARGGDIDLLIELDPRIPVDVFGMKQKLLLALEDALGAQKIDVLIDDGRRDEPFLAVARQQGETLWTNG